MGGRLLYIPERHAYLLYGGDNNTVQYNLVRAQSKNPGLESGGVMTPSKKQAQEQAIAKTAAAVSTDAVKNDKIYFYDIGSRGSAPD